MLTFVVVCIKEILDLEKEKDEVERTKNEEFFEIIKDVTRQNKNFDAVAGLISYASSLSI